jgi:hypothetical protein
VRLSYKARIKLSFALHDSKEAGSIPLL